MEVSVFYSPFTSGGGVDEMLARLLLIEKIMKDANLICISFSVIHRYFENR